MGVGVLPVFHPRFNQPAPESGVTVGVEVGTDQIVMGVAGAAHHVFGRGLHGDQLGIARQRRIMLLQQVEQTQRFGGKTVGQVEPRQVQARKIGQGLRRMRHDLGQLAFGGQKTAAAGDAPAGEVQVGGSIAIMRQR